MNSRYAESEKYLERVLKTIPLGSQTFSKSMQSFPYGGSPFFAVKGKGQHIWDLDGNKYVDFSNSLAAINLGYAFEPVDSAVRAQLENGVSFSLPHPLEGEVAELLVDIIPCAEMVRFGKNGSDSTSAAIRLSRAYTGRDKIAACGYHGWHDWYIGSTARNKGVPKAVQDLTKTFNYNDIESLEKVFQENPNEIAAVILEPMNSYFPKDGFLEKVKALTHKHGAVLVFDETVTGLRYAVGGAQQFFNVTPDLACFGKGLANGYPLSAIVGRKDIMKLMEDIFYSGTFGGETLSLAAGKACIKFSIENDVPGALYKKGERLMKGVEETIKKNNVQNFVSISGHPSWSILKYSDVGSYNSFELKTLHMQEMLSRGFLVSSSHNMSWSITEADINGLLMEYDRLFSIMGEAVASGTLDKKIHCQKLKPLFQVRKN